jgi:pyridoxamine 5'-phosphate oxidase
VFALNFEDCIKFANNYPVAYLATVDEKDQPHVRALAMWYADKTGFYFQSGTMKELYGQLKKNPQSEVCFFNNKSEGGLMLRVTGEVEFLDDPKMKEKVIEDRQFLKVMGLTSASPGLVIFRIAKGIAHFWTMETNFKPKELIKFG